MNEVNKLARTVLRGGRGSNAPDLPDFMLSGSTPHVPTVPANQEKKKNEAHLKL